MDISTAKSVKNKSINISIVFKIRISNLNSLICLNSLIQVNDRCHNDLALVVITRIRCEQTSG